MPIPEEYTDLLEKPGFAHLATIGPNKEPQSTPVWYGWDGEQILVSQTKDRQKYRNVKRDPRVALSITDPENPYRHLEIRGEVVEIEEDEGNAFINSMAKKYTGDDVYAWGKPGEQRIVLHIVPRHTTHMG